MKDEPSILGLNFQEAERQPNPSEYRGADGLIYCEVCGQPVQCRLTEEVEGFSQAQGKTIRLRETAQHLKENNPEKYEEWKKQWLGVFPIYCRCGDERYKRIQKLQQQQERNRKVSENRMKGLASEKIRACTFSADRNPQSKTSQTAKRYADKFDTETKKYSLLLYGASGTGKTFTAGCIANALTEQGRYVLYLPVRQILSIDKGSGWAEMLSEIRQCDLLILDDLETIDKYGYEADYIMTAIDTRQDTMKPMIVTTSAKQNGKSDRSAKLRTRLSGFVPIKHETHQTPNYSQQELNSFLGDAVTI